MKKLIQNKKYQILFTLLGAAGGFLYWKFIGCNNGTCAIKSVWYWSTLWGAAMGFLVSDFLYDFVVKRKSSKEEK